MAAQGRHVWGPTNRGVGVQVGAHVLDLELQLLLRPLRGALFNGEMRSARVPRPSLELGRAPAALSRPVSVP